MRFSAILALTTLVACGGKSISPIDETAAQPASAPSANNTVAAPDVPAPVVVDAGAPPRRGAVLAAKPAAAPEAGTFSWCQAIVLSSTTPVAQVRYTLDGSDPTIASPLYEAPIPLKQTTTIHARAFSAGFEPSAMMVATYVLNSPGYGIMPVAFDPPPDATNAGSLTIELSQPSPNNFICFTRDGSEPRCNAETCGAPGQDVRVKLETSTKLRAVSCMSKLPPDCPLGSWRSDVVDAEYTLQ